ncbi:MAG: hypothetical protein ACK559_35625 [bacterium]
MFLRALVHDAWSPPRVIRGPSPRRREMGFLLAGGLDSHHLCFSLLIALATLLVLSARARIAGGR